MPVRVPLRGLVVPPRLRAPALLWALYAVQTALIAGWPGFFVDHAVDGLVERLGTVPLTGLAARLGARELLLPLALAAGAVLSWRRRTLVPLVLLVGTYLLVGGVTGLTKVALARPQPLPVLGVEGRSFPSGHAAQAAAVYSALALLSGRDWRRLAAPVAAVVGVVCAALLLRRAHWPSDMVAGVTLGLACLTTVRAALYATFRVPPMPLGMWKMQT